MKRYFVALGAAAALSATGASASPQAQTLKFMSVTQRTVFTPMPTRSAPPRVGGRLIFEDVMYNHAAQLGKPRGAHVGRAEGVCTVIRVTGPAAQCVITAHLPNGEIVVVGEGDPGGKVAQYAITGGIGAYANARGTVTATTVSEQKSIITVRLNA